MSIRTVHIEPGLVVVLRRGFEMQTDSNGVPASGPNGEPVYVAEAIVPGKVRSTFAVDNDSPAGVKLKVVGTNPGYGAGQKARLNGRVTLTAWYSPRARGNDARSDITITAERVDHAPSAEPALHGGIPAVMPGEVEMTLLAATPDGRCDVMLSAASSYVVDGIAEVRCRGAVPADLVGQTVTAEGLRAYFVAPDREDVSQRSKAELVLACDGFSRPGSSGFTPRNRRSEPTPEPTPEPAAT